MAPSIKSLSPKYLQGLLKGPKVNVFFKADDASEIRLLTEAYPRAILVQFCGRFESVFPAVNKTSLVDLTKPIPTNATVVGGDAEIHLEILKWMTSSCQGHGIQPYPVFTEHKFWRYSKVLEAAKILELRYLVEEMTKRVDHITNFQVHSEDVCQVFGNLERGHYLRNVVIQSVGNAILEKRLKARSAYSTVQTDYPQFRQGLNKYLAARRHGQAMTGLADWDGKLDRTIEEKITRETSLIKQINSPQHRSAVRKNKRNVSARGPLIRGYSNCQQKPSPAKSAISTGDIDNNFKIVTIPTRVARQGKKGIDKDGNPIIRGRYYKPAWENIDHFHG